VLNSKEESELAERLETCAEVIKRLVKGAMENGVDLREGINGGEVGSEIWFAGCARWKIPETMWIWGKVDWTLDFPTSKKRHDVKKYSGGSSES